MSHSIIGKMSLQIREDFSRLKSYSCFYDCSQLLVMIIVRFGHVHLAISPNTKYYNYCYLFGIFLGI